MAETDLSAESLGQLFAPEADLSVYETMPERDLYFALMRSVFVHQGKSEDALTAPFVGIYRAVTPADKTETDDVVPVSGAEDRELRVRTAAIDDAYAGIGRPWGPSSSIILSTADESHKIVELNAAAIQEHQELFMGAFATILNPLTGKPESRSELVKSSWAGNTAGTEASEAARRIFPESAFRDITPEEKRVLGVALEGLGQLALTAA